MDNSQQEQLDHIKGVVETLLFITERPVELNQIKNVLETVSVGEIKKVLHTLMQDYDGRGSGVKIVEIAGGYQMLSNPKYASYVRAFYTTRHKAKLSKPALETMAIIAYKQPITRADIELIRGVNSDGVVTHLSDKELIKIVGRKDIPGKPFLYGTTKQFLEYFGLRSLEDLPKLEEFPQLQPHYEQSMGENDASGSEEGIPESVLSVNSLEQVKQSAIQNAKKEQQKDAKEIEAGVNVSPETDELSQDQ